MFTNATGLTKRGLKLQTMCWLFIGSAIALCQSGDSVALCPGSNANHWNPFRIISKGFLIVSKRPLVGVSCCTRLPEDPVQAVAERYLRTAPFMGADVVLVPSMRDILDIGSIVGRLDGILLTGSPSNVAPNLCGGTEVGGGPFDPARDEAALRLITAAVEQDRPVLGICRGFQEIAVAYGATLRRDLGQSDREQIHHTPPGRPLDEMFSLQHRVALSPGGDTGTRHGCIIDHSQLGAFSRRRRSRGEAHGRGDEFGWHR